MEMKKEEQRKKKEEKRGKQPSADKSKQNVKKEQRPYCSSGSLLPGSVLAIVFSSQCCGFHLSSSSIPPSIHCGVHLSHGHSMFV